MSAPRRPPRLLVKALLVTFGTVAALLVVVFFFVRMSVRDQVRQTIADNLDHSQRTVAALQKRRQHELRAQVANLAENPTLKAAIDTYAAEARGGDGASVDQLVTTIQRELGKLAARIEADAIVLVDGRANTLAAVGRLGDRWPRGRPVSDALSSDDMSDFDGVMQAGADTFRAVAVPLTLDEGVSIGTLFLANVIDHDYAEQLDRMLRARVAILNDGLVIATTLSAPAARQFESIRAHDKADQGTISLEGAAYAYRQLAAVGPAAIYAVSSIDEAADLAMRQANRSLAGIAFGAFALALLGSAWLANVLTKPIEQLSRSLDRIAASHDVHVRLPLVGSSRELDALTQTFNTLMSSVADAEAQTEAAYAGAIRALAAALDARDPYTAGHSERVSALSVAIGRGLELRQDEIEVLRLGALLHDIGKIGVSDEVLRKGGPLTPAEYDAIRAHPVFGAKILRTVPFLSPHIPIVELHHERPDGRGYPYGLRGHDIPLLARVVHVADAYDAITSARAYRAARSGTEALRELWRCAGTEFDAEIVGALATVLRGSKAGEIVEANGAIHGAARRGAGLMTENGVGLHPCGPDRTAEAVRHSYAALRHKNALQTTAVVLLLALPADTAAQGLSRVSLDSVASVDVFRIVGAADRPDASLDIGAVARITDGRTAYVRPWFFKSSQAATWDKEIYQAALQYQRAGRASTPDSSRRRLVSVCSTCGRT